MAVELYFDAASEAAVRRVQQAIHSAGVERPPGPVDARPHISLTVTEGASAALEPAVRAFARRTPPLPVRLSVVASFPGEQNVLFLAPTPDKTLLTLHRSFHVALHSAEVGSRPHYRPGAWVPHCTLAMNMPEAQLPRAFAVARAAFEPFSGRLEGIGIVTLPLRTARLFPLDGHSGPEVAV